MVNSLLIEKETGGYFGFTLTIDGIGQDKIRNMANDALGIGNICHFKTQNGANLVKVQNISVFDITLIASGTFTFTNIDVFFQKLIDVGYWDWLLGGGGGGSGADRFDELLDTFQYFGKNGQGVRVNESQQKLETFTVYNYRTLIELEDTFDTIVPNKMLVTNSAGTRVELADLPTEPEQYLQSVGFFDYADLATQTTPLSLVSNVSKKLTNDTLGDSTNTSNAPYGVSSVWNATSNVFDFSQLSIGDTIDIRFDVNVTTTVNNQIVKGYVKLGVGSPSEYILGIFGQQIKTPASNTQTVLTSIYIGNTDIINYPSEVYLLTENSGSAKVNGWYCRILKKNINIVDVNIIGDDFVKKQESVDFIANYGATLIVNQIDLIDNRNSISLIGSATDVKSINLSAQFIRAGKPHFFKNRTAHNVKLWHLAGTGNIKYFFPNGLDLIVKPNEVIAFNTNANDSANVRFEYVGNYADLTNYYTKTEVDALDAVVLATANSYTDTELLDKADLVGGKVPTSQLPSYVNDVIEGYLLSNVFYEESSHTTVILAEVGKIYIDLTAGQNNKGYRYSGSTYIQITNGLIASTDDVPEGSSNLYFQTARVLATLLTGISFATGGAIVSTDSVLVAFGKLQKQLNDALTSIGLKQDTLVSGTNIKTVNGTSLLGSGNLNTPDMDTTTAQTVSGVKTFLSGMLGLRNVANTFTSFFTNANTASRTYTLQDRTGTLAMLDDFLPQITITTSISITTATNDASGFGQKGRNVIIANGASAINLTVNGGTDFCASYLKGGTGAITFVQGSGRTLVQVDSTAILNGIVGSTAIITSIGTTDYLRISNA